MLFKDTHTCSINYDGKILAVHLAATIAFINHQGKEVRIEVENTEVQCILSRLDIIIILYDEKQISMVFI